MRIHAKIPPPMRDLCLLFLILFSLWACGPRERPEGRTVVVVGSTHVGIDRFKKDMEFLGPGSGIPAGTASRIPKPVINRMIDYYLVLEYGKKNGITVSPARLRRYLKEVESGYTGDGLRDALLRGYMDPKEWKDRLAERLRVRTILKQVSEGVPPPDYRDVKAYYDQHLKEFRVPESVAFRQIVTRTRKAAEALLERLRKGEDMGTLAGKYSIAPEAENAGKVGWVARGQLEKTMEKALFSLPVGKISPVVKSPYGFHIFEVLSRRPGAIRPLPEVIGEIRERLVAEKRDRFLEKWLRDLRARFRIRINHELLSRLEMS